MSHWNHRVVRREQDGEVTFAIHEAYYFDDPPAITESPEAAEEESLETLRKTLRHMLAACDQPVLDYETRKEIA